MALEYSLPSPLCSPKASRDDKTRLELFIAGVRGWEAGIRRRMADGEPE